VPPRPQNRWTLQAAEKPNGKSKKCQGTTSVVPLAPQNRLGFSP
jgi:hypothetical protein